MMSKASHRRRVASSIAQWRVKSFVQLHRVSRAGSQGNASAPETIMECDEMRIFAGRRADGSIRALPIPQQIRTLCE